MKKNIILALLSCVLCASCNEAATSPEKNKEPGYLTLGEISIDETTKAAVAAGGNYTIIVNDADNQQVVKTTYSAVISAGNKISLPEGEYVLIARSSEEEVQPSAFEQPIYGTSKAVTIVSGKETSLGALTCTLLQCKVTVSYNDDFLGMVTGNGKATVSVKAGYPLEYNLNYNNGHPIYDQAAGYFAIDGTSSTMEVVFSGSIDGKSQKMTKVFTDVQPRQWHQIKFIKKVDAEGGASFDITIDDFVEDETLNNNVQAVEKIIGTDPSAPTGDGGIKLESTCSYDITKPIVVSPAGQTFVLTMKATIPNKVKKFTVEIESTNPNFIISVKSVNDGSAVLDLVNPSDGAIAVFTNILPFPYGDAVYNKESIDFDLSDAQTPILAFEGTHTFIMKVVDQKGCSKSIEVKLVVE